MSTAPTVSTTVDAAPPEQVLVELDDRRRSYLSKVGRPEHRRYLARTLPDGTVILTPAVILTEHEMRLMQRPDVLAAMREPEEHPERLVRGRKRPSLTE